MFKSGPLHVTVVDAFIFPSKITYCRNFIVSCNVRMDTICSLKHWVLYNHVGMVVHLWFVLPREQSSLQSGLSSQLIWKVSAVFKVQLMWLTITEVCHSSTCWCITPINNILIMLKCSWLERVSIDWTNLASSRANRRLDLVIVGKAGLLYTDNMKQMPCCDIFM